MATSNLRRSDNCTLSCACGLGRIDGKGNSCARRVYTRSACCGNGSGGDGGSDGGEDGGGKGGTSVRSYY